jgi:hypothetical protein
MLVNVVDINIEFTRAPEAFYLWGHSNDPKVFIKILEANLFVTHVELKPLFF